MSRANRSSGQLVMHAIHRPGEGWVCEFWTKAGELRHTTAVFRDKAAALQAAKDWRRQQQEVTRK